MEKFKYKYVENNRELEGVQAVRRKVFVEEQGIDEELVFSRNEGTKEKIVIALQKETVIGTARIVFTSENKVKIERMAVLEWFRNQGVGKGIIDFLNTEFKKHQVKYVFLHAQLDATNFYRSCGFRESGPYFIEADIKHIRMELEYTQ